MEFLMFLEGLFSPSWLALVLITLAMTHFTIIGVTVYLHRYSAHRALALHPVVTHFFRLWLWLTTGMNTKAWTAIHRKHHARCETEEDPHSPQVMGLSKVLGEGAELYRAEAANQETLDKYGAGTPDDWMERNVYTRHGNLGIYVMMAINLVCFGPIGLTVWAVQMLWIPVLAAGVINGVGHYWGYRNFECTDASRNISPLGLLIGGEELHNNHHTYPNSAKLSVRRFEFDVGWFWIRVFELLGLAKVKKVAPRPLYANKASIDLDTVRALVHNRFQVMARYRREVIKPVFQEEKARASEATRRAFRRARALFWRDEGLLDERGRKRLDRLTRENERLATIYQYRLRLQQIWSRTSQSSSEMLESLKQWCRDAESSGIRSLEEFAEKLRAYTVQPAG
jgi:stearoyl-CoA desaturase (delta-9 desaturase)